MSCEPHTLQVPPPKDWQDFERRLRDLFEAHWRSRATMHGRVGQPQHGVDIYGQPEGDNKYHGVQCKLHDSNVNAEVTEAELNAEIKKATKFKPRLARFILGTTAPRDVKIQAVVRRLNERKSKPFSVEVLFWDDILALYGQHAEVFARHYPFVSPGRHPLHQLSESRERAAREIASRFAEQLRERPNGAQVVWLDMRGAGSAGEFYVRYATNDFTEAIDVLRFDELEPENLLHLEAPGEDLGATHVRLGGRDYLFAWTRGGSGGYLTLRIYTYDGVGKLEVVHTEDELFQGDILVRDGRVFLAGNNQRFELIFDNGRFQKAAYTAHLSPKLGPGTHVLAFSADEGRLKFSLDGEALKFRRKSRDTSAAVRPIYVRSGEMVCIDEQVDSPQQVRMLTDSDKLVFEPGFFTCFRVPASGEYKLSFSHNYATWYNITLKVE